MKMQVKLPQLAPEMASAVIVAWLKAEGEPVAAGEALFEVETDKVVSSVEAEAAGTLEKILVPAGEACSVGSVVAEIEG